MSWSKAVISKLNKKSKSLPEIEEFIEYFSELLRNKSKYIVILATRDNIGVNMSEEYADSLLNLGLKTDLHKTRGLNGRSHLPYIAILDCGQIVYEELGDGGSKNLTYDEGNYYIRSTVFTRSEGCEDAVLAVNGYDYCVNSRGINVVVINKEDDEIIDSVCFDCFTDECGLKRVKPNDIKAKIITQREYMAFREGFKPDKMPMLALHKPPHPFGEICVIVGHQPSQELSQLASRENLNNMRMNEAIVLSTLEAHSGNDGTKYIFSGQARYNGKFIFGTDDIIKYGLDVCVLRDGIGQFEMLRHFDNKIELSTDFFGMCQWFYYYGSNNEFIVATSYHLLLLTLKALNYELKIDINKVSAMMGCFHPFSHNNFTKEMDVEGCFELPMDKRIVINPDKSIVFENSEIYDAMYNPEEYSDYAYEKYLYQARDELIEDVRAVFEHPSFDHVICDITGGFDSRMVLCAATNLPNSLTCKLRMRTDNVPGEDLRIACEIVNAFGLKWDDISLHCDHHKTGIIGDTLYQAQQSGKLGTAFAYNYKSIPEFNKTPKSIRLTGNCGGVMYRDLSNIFFPTTDFAREEQDDILNAIGRHNFTSATAANKYREYMKRNILQINKETLKGKIDLYYAYFRNRHHFKTKYNNSTWMPLQSKAAFKLKMMYFTKNVDDKIQYDIMPLLNPLLANFPYDTNEKNKNKIAYAECLYSKGFPTVNLSFSDRGLSQPPTKIIEKTSGESMSTFYDAIDTTSAWYEKESTLLSALHTFLNYSNGFEDLGMPLYKSYVVDRYKNVQNANMKFMRVNRILSIYWQIAIINNEQS